MAKKRVCKLFQKVVTKCIDCPNCVDEPDSDPEKGWWTCKQQFGKRLDNRLIDKTIDADCPLLDAP